MNCPICDEIGVLCDFKLKIDDEEILIKGYKCCDCGEEFFSYEQKNEIDKIVKKHSKLEYLQNPYHIFKTK